MKKSVISPMLAEVSNTLTDTTPEPRPIVLNHKQLIKSGITHKQPKPGKNKPAKGYNPETKTWTK